MYSFNIIEYIGLVSHLDIYAGVRGQLSTAILAMMFTHLRQRVN